MTTRTKAKKTVFKENLKKALFQDKRRAERLSLALKIFYRLENRSAWGSPIDLVDISGGGLKFKGNERLRRHTLLSLKISLPYQKEAIFLEAEVMWCRKLPSKARKEFFSVGVMFHKMYYNDRKRLVTYLCDEILSHTMNGFKGTIF